MPFCRQSYRRSSVPVYYKSTKLTKDLQTAALFVASVNNPSKVGSLAPATVTMLILFNLFYPATWGTVAFLIPTEIFPSEMRA